MVLWKKESARANALYKNLFPTDEIDHNITKCVMNLHGITNIDKNDDKATEFRKSGNEKFVIKHWREAMEMYNKSLRFATKESENVSLAYANRSACFLRMEMYNECLADIELAREANYPQRLMAKLDERERNCLELMKNIKDEPEKEEPALIFDPDEKYPSMANVLEIKYNEQYGKHIIAKNDIKVGQVVLTEEIFVFDATQFNQSCCKTCIHFSKNLIPCASCTEVMFCDVKCMEANKIHKLACGVPYHRLPELTVNLDSILIAVTAFSSANELMKFVESALTTRDSTDSPECNSIIQSKYCLFLKLLVQSNQMDKSQYRKLTLVYWMLFEIPLIKERFDTQPKRRFLMHLILQHMLILETNSYAYITSSETVGIQLMSIASSLFNHSCFPNISLNGLRNQIGVVVRPVKKGEQLFTQYVDGKLSTEDRQLLLQKHFHFQCKCEKCVPCFKQEDRLRMMSDPNYQLIFRLDDLEDNLVRKMLKTKCQELLSKYGRSPWCEEIEIVLNRFNKCWLKELVD